MNHDRAVGTDCLILFVLKNPRNIANATAG